MNLHFITSISKEYWYATGQYCISTWDLPGKVTVYVEQTAGDIRWIQDIPFEVSLLPVPLNEALTGEHGRRKVLKFWGKSYAQIFAHRNRANNERIIWIDADVEQLKPVKKEQFDFPFVEPVAMMYSGEGDDCWETGLVLFNHMNPKIGQFINQYEEVWNDLEFLNSIWKPYDALVLGQLVLSRGYYNLCTKECLNVDALDTSIYSTFFKHWINKDNKNQLARNNESSNISQISTKREKSRKGRFAKPLFSWNHC